MSQQSSLDAARDYIKRGWRVIPLKQGTKKPSESQWQKTSIPEDQLTAKFTKTTNVGVALGPASNGLADIDLDEALTVTMSGHFLPKTGAIFGRPGKRKAHRLHYVTDETIRRKQFIDEDGTLLAEIRGNGHQTMMPPSIHPNGERIEWECDGEPSTLTYREIEVATGWLCSASMLARHWSLWTDQHHYLTMHLAGGLLRSGVKVQPVLDFVRAVCLYGGDTEIEDRLATVTYTADKIDAGEELVTGFPSLAEIIGIERVRLLIGWMQIKTPGDGIANTDSGNALRLVAHYGEKLRYCHEWERWLIWNGALWQTDKHEQIMTHARQIPRIISDEAAKATSDDRTAALNKWAIKSQDAARLSAMVKLARSDVKIVAPVETLDRDPWLFNVANGTVNLRTGGLQSHDPSDMLTKRSPVEFDPRSECPLWMQYLEGLFAGEQREALIEFAQRLAGYTLTGMTSEHVFVILYGPTGTGKTTFIETMRYIFGDYAGNANAQTFMQKQSTGRASPDIAKLQGARLVTASETEENARMSSALVKRLSGGDRVTASFLYANEFEYDPVMKIWLATNNKPRVSGDDDALFQRMILIPFVVQFRRMPNEIKGLKDHLRREASGILKWAIEGCLQWQSDGLGRPPAVEDAVNEYQHESDQIGLFLDNCCELVGDGSTGSMRLFNRYRTWCEEVNERPFSNRRFKASLETRGFEARHTASGTVWYGIKCDEAESGYRTQYANPFAKN
jgi:putative DNA primase/helicase